MSFSRSIAVACCCIALSSAQAAPLSPTAHPKTFCELAADVGYPSRGYKTHTGGCATNYIDVTPTSGRNGLANNMAFYSMGEDNNPSRLMRLSLILNVNNTREVALSFLFMTSKLKFNRDPFTRPK